MSTRNEALAWKRWQQREAKRLTRRIKPRGKYGAPGSCDECHQRFDRVNGKDIVVKTPAHGYVCTTCATTGDPKLLLPLGCLVPVYIDRQVVTHACMHQTDPLSPHYGWPRFSCPAKLETIYRSVPTGDLLIAPGITIWDVLKVQRLR